MLLSNQEACHRKASLLQVCVSLLRFAESPLLGENRPTSRSRKKGRRCAPRRGVLTRGVWGGMLESRSTTRVSSPCCLGAWPGLVGQERVGPLAGNSASLHSRYLQESSQLVGPTPLQTQETRHAPPSSLPPFFAAPPAGILACSIMISGRASGYKRPAIS